MKGLRIHKSGIYTHKEMDGAYRQGYRAGYNDASNEKKNNTIRLQGEHGKPLGQIRYEREVYRKGIDKWEDMNETVRKLWRLRGRLKKEAGFNVFMKDFIEKIEKKRRGLDYL